MKNNYIYSWRRWEREREQERRIDKCDNELREKTQRIRVSVFVCDHEICQVYRTFVISPFFF